MPDHNEAASQPAPSAQTSDGGRGKNITVDQLTAMLQRTPQAPEEAPAEVVAEAVDEPNKPHADATETVESESTAEAGEQPAETTEQPEAAEAEATEDAEVLSQDLELPPEVQAKIGKRIGKEVAKRKALEEQIAAAQAELEALKTQAAQQQQQEQAPAPVPVVADPSQPLSHVTSLDKLREEHAAAKEISRIAEDLLDQFDGGAETVEFQGQAYNKMQVKTILRNAKRTLEDHIPTRAQFLQNREQWRSKAIEEFPFLKDRTSKEYQMVEAARRNYPIIQSLPDADYVLGLAVEGLKAIEARKAKPAAPAKPVAPAKAPASQVASAATPARPRVADDVVRRQQVGREVAAIKSKRNLSTSDVTTILLKQQQAR